MAPKSGVGNPKKVIARASRDNEWVPSLMGKTELNEMVEASSLPDRVTARWRLTDGEPYPMPYTDKAVVFKDYFWHRLGFPIHPLLRDLLEFWGVSLCNLHPNTILHISIFIYFCEAYLGFFHTLISSYTCSS